MKLNIAIKFPPKAIADLIKLSKDINAEYNSSIKLDDGKLIPHLTLYQTEFPDESYKQIKTMLVELVSSIKRFELEAKDTLSVVYDGGVYLDYIPDRHLVGLHTRVVDGLSPLREGLVREKYFDGSFMKDLSEDEKSMAIKYSSPWVFHTYNPHTTLAKLLDKGDHSHVINQFKPLFKRIIVEEVGIYESGKSGVCKSLLMSVKLKR